MALIKNFQFDYEEESYTGASGVKINMGFYMKRLIRAPYKLKVAPDFLVIAQRNDTASPEYEE